MNGLEAIAYERACLKFMESIHVERFRQIRSRKEYQLLPTCMKQPRFLDALAQLDEITLEDVKPQMLTITPRDGICLNWSLLIQLVEKITSFKNLLQHPEWCYEQRSEDLNNPRGFHVHIAFHSKQCKADIIRRVNAQVKKIFKDPEDNWVQVNPYSPQAYSYVHGNKIKEKESKLLADELIRKKYNLDKVYKKEEEWFTKKEHSVATLEDRSSSQAEASQKPLPRHSM